MSMNIGAFLLRAAALTVLLLAALAFGLWRRRADGRSRAVPAGERLTASDLGAPLGTAATLVQFSAPVCAPCRAAHRVLSAAAGATPGVVHVEVDAGEHLELARRLGVLRTPTTLVLSPDGRVVARSSGVPTPPQVAEALTLAGATAGAVA
jgi:thiol-disulfide isomerase/thioredoxin